MPILSIVVPVLHDDHALHGLLENLQRELGTMRTKVEVIVVDGAASARTREVVQRQQAAWHPAPASRGSQICHGIELAQSHWMWILHADTQISTPAFEYLLQRVNADELCWGRFDVALPGLGIVAWFMNWRSRLSKMCTGDQAMFVHRELLQRAGGFPQQPLMEDIEVSKRLKRIAAKQFRAPRIAVFADVRRWRKHGVFKTVLGMWRFRWRYWQGADAQQLYREYYQGAPDR